MIRKQPTQTKAKAGKRTVRIWRRGMGEMARHLGVSRTHLWFVVTGERRSPRIERDAAFRAWRASL